MARSTKRSPSGLLSEAGKKAVRGVVTAAKKLVGKKTPGKSASGHLPEAARKAGRGLADRMAIRVDLCSPLARRFPGRGLGG